MLLVFIRNHFYEKWKPIRLTNIVFVCQGGILVQNFEGFEITVESLGDTRKNAEQGIEYLEILKGFEGSSEAISDIVRAEILSKSTLINHKITFYFKNPIIGQDYAKKLMKYINSNEYFVELIEVYTENSKERIKQNLELAKQIDGLIASYADKLAEKDKTTTSGTISFDTEEKVDVTGLFNLKNDLLKDTENKKVDLKTRTEAVKVINFGKPQQVQKTFYGKKIVLIPFIFVGLFFLVSFLKFLNKKSSEILG